MSGEVLGDGMAISVWDSVGSIQWGQQPQEHREAAHTGRKNGDRSQNHSYGS